MESDADENAAGLGGHAKATYIGVEQVTPGDTVTVQLKFYRPQFHVGRIAVGMEFQIREGKRTVAKGQVTKILHLKENALAMRSIVEGRFR